MKYIFLHEPIWLMPIFLFLIGFSSCSDDKEESVVSQLTIESAQQSKTFVWDEQEASVKFTATAAWTATVEDVAGRATGSRAAHGLHFPDMKVKRAKFLCLCCFRRMIARTTAKQSLL